MKICGISAGAPTIRTGLESGHRQGKRRTKRESCLQTDSKIFLLNFLPLFLSLNVRAVKAKKAGRQLYSSQSDSNQYPEGKEGRKWMHIW